MTLIWASVKVLLSTSKWGAVLKRLESFWLAAPPCSAVTAADVEVDAEAAPGPSAAEVA